MIFKDASNTYMENKIIVVNICKKLYSTQTFDLIHYKINMKHNTDEQLVRPNNRPNNNNLYIFHLL